MFSTRFTINTFNAKSIHVSTLFFFFFSLFFLLLFGRFLCKIKVTEIVFHLVRRESRESYRYRHSRLLRASVDLKLSFVCTYPTVSNYVNAIGHSYRWKYFRNTYVETTEDRMLVANWSVVGRARCNRERRGSLSSIRPPTLEHLHSCRVSQLHTVSQCSWEQRTENANVFELAWFLTTQRVSWLYNRLQSRCPRRDIPAINVNNRLDKFRWTGDCEIPGDQMSFWLPLNKE